MKKRLFVLILLSLFLLSGCSSVFVDLDTPKSSDLKEKYSFYQKSVDNIRTNMKVTPEEADEIFIILCDCGVSEEINNVYGDSDGKFSVWSSGDKYTVTLDGSVVDTVVSGKETLYPAQEETEDVKVSEPPKPTEAVEEEETATTNTSDIQSSALKKVQSVFGKDNVITVDYFDDTKFLSIETSGKENLTNKMTLRGMYLDMETLLKDFSDLENVDINFDIHYSFVDKKGNASDRIAIRARYDWNDRKDVNWDKFLTPNIPDISTSWAIHPAFENIIIE